MNEPTGVGPTFADACDDGELISICCLCGKTFSSQSLLHKHFELMHEGTEIDTEQYDLSGFAAMGNEQGRKSNGEEDASKIHYCILNNYDLHHVLRCVVSIVYHLVIIFYSK
ncbi:unnamed protein product [Schistosoma margrebowiei]|uniref:Uncharacterized protein n=2 Tax=Schistosoma TaxID=6181 RepID=A0A183NAT3_9TREM|nr:unnamed protein product [Schistosoma margrebowiei]